MIENVRISHNYAIIIIYWSVTSITVSTQSEYEFVSIDELVPDNHLLRLIDKYIDLSFLLEKVRPYYSDDNGRPSDPTILFKMMLLDIFMA
ncbi:hypothetical protein J7E63_00895, partial [Bacillus sp. ISL-75]|nr:hypothetical protein [Bacillus sp. ISL-75]